MGILDGDIAVVTKKVYDAALEAVSQMLDDDSEIVTIIFGEDLKQKDADKLAAAILAIDDDLEVEIHDGQQPLYPYLLAVE